MAENLSSPRDVVIDVDNVTMIFNMASEQLNNLKEYFIKIMHHELFFKEFRALKNISFQVKRGEVVGLVGTNGSGKSTMLKIIAGVLDPSEGSIEVRGNIAPLIELGAGFDMELTARENIYLNGSLLGYTKEFIDAHFDEIVEFAELKDFVDMPLKNYSSGMVARIAFAIATITEPDILIVDETLSVGDVFFQEKCERRIRHFIESGDVTVLFVSHSMQQVERICKRAIWIEKGVLRMDGPVDVVCEAYRDQFVGADGAEGSSVALADVTPLPPSLKHYVDLRGDDWYVDSVKYVVEHGYMTGRDETHFGPDNRLTCGQALSVIAKMAGADLGVQIDDSLDTTHHPEVLAWARAEGIVEDLPGRAPFDMSAVATRGDVFQLMFALNQSPHASEPSSWRDTPEWAKPAVAWAIERGVVKVSSIRACDPCGRAEMAALILRLMAETN